MTAVCEALQTFDRQLYSDNRVSQPQELVGDNRPILIIKQRFMKSATLRPGEVWLSYYFVLVISKTNDVLPPNPQTKSLSYSFWAVAHPWPSIWMERGRPNLYPEHTNVFFRFSEGVQSCKFSMVQYSGYLIVGLVDRLRARELGI